ncbi:MAG: hypothetical protein OIN89_05355 [Candidatus Methanoperedens sp.]|nr:hypothetical protein [Candidatus Methanoperedens sp.]
MGAIVIGGARYLTSVGNPSAIGDAKDTISSAIAGLLLAITSWVIINTINPDVLVIKKPDMPPVESRYGSGGKTTSCALPGGNEKIKDIGCDCIDGAKKVYKIPTTVTLDSPKPNETTTAGNVTFFSGTLKNKDTGASLTGETVTIYAISFNKMRSAYKGNISMGLYNGSAGFVCAAEFQLVAYYPGNETYAPSASALVKYTTTGGAACAEADFTLPLMNFAEASNCNAICAIPDDFHCLKPVLGVGKTQEDAMAGYQNLTAVKNQPIFFDAVSKTVTAYPIGEIDISYETDWGAWLRGDAYEYKCAVNGGCSNSDAKVTTCVNPAEGFWQPPYNAIGKSEGRFMHTFTSAGNHPIRLLIGVKMPDGRCMFVKDTSTIIKVLDK